MGSVKSHWFSAMPMKSRMAGSVVQARRNAALVSSAGTPFCRNARMSLPATMELIGGNVAGSKGGSAPRAPVREAAPASAAGSSSGAWRRRLGLACALALRLPLAARPAGNEIVLAHRSLSRRPPPPSGRWPARRASRWRLKNGRST